jgi:hypothetical protein
MDSPLLQIESVCVRIHRKEILRDISMEIEPVISHPNYSFISIPQPLFLQPSPPGYLTRSDCFAGFQQIRNYM